MSFDFSFVRLFEVR